MVLVIDSLLIGGIRFVLDKLVQSVDAELSDDTVLREELLAAQMRLELGEITPEEFKAFEADVLARLRDIRERQIGETAALTPASGDVKVTGVEATAYDSPEE